MLQECSLWKFSVFVETCVTLITRKDGRTAKWLLHFNSSSLINLRSGKLWWKRRIGGKFFKGHSEAILIFQGLSQSVIPLHQHLPQGKHLYAECQSPDFHLYPGFQVWKTSELHDHRKCLSLSFISLLCDFFSVEFIHQIMYIRVPWLDKIQYRIVMLRNISEMLIHL